MAHKSFAAAKAEALGDPITFDIDGVEFTIPRPIPAWPMLELAAAGDEDDQTAIAVAFIRFLMALIPADQHARFTSTCTEKRVDADLLLEIVQFVIEEASGRPTVPPSSSDGRPSTIGTPSNGAVVPSGSSPR